MMKKIKKAPRKKEFVTEADAIMDAFYRVNLREAIAPTVRGRIVEDEETYNKVQQLLDCPDMEHAHKFLLDVDFEELTPELVQKIDDLYKLAVSQGYIEAGPSEGEEDDSDDFNVDTSEETVSDKQEQPTDASGGFEGDVPNAEAAAAKDSINSSASTIASCAYTLFYSAMKNGEIKTGECYSNATTLENAKIDAVQKLQKLGFTAVDIIAAEECDPNARGCPTQQPEDFGAPVNNTATTNTEPVGEAKEDAEEEIVEADDSEEKDAEKEEPKEEPENDDSSEELSRSEKLDYFKRYLDAFKELLRKMKAECYAEMDLASRAKFYDEMEKAWAGKPDPTTFMTDANTNQIEHMRVKLSK